MPLKSFCARFLETEGERSNTFYCLIVAENLRKAKKAANKQATEWFDVRERDRGDGGWYFFNLQIHVKLEAVYPITLGRYITERISEQILFSNPTANVINQQLKLEEILMRLDFDWTQLW
jgi:hypothetical protein